MGISIPVSVDSKGEDRNSGGGAVAGDPWKDWISLPLDMSDGWTRINGSGGAACTFTKTTDGSGDLLTAEMHGATSADNVALQNTGATKNGVWMIRNDFIDPFALAGLALPPGQSNWWVDPEKFVCKLEVKFDTIPITGPSGSPPTGSDYGNVLQVDAGIVWYSTDQGGAPVIPVQEHNAASMFKGSIDPETAGNAFMAGNNNYSTRGHSWAKFKCQASYETTGADAIIFTLGVPIPKPKANSQSMLGGAYSTIDPFGDIIQYGNTFNSTGAWRNGQYCHFYLSFGAYSNGLTRGTVKIRSIRILIQPITGRETFVDL